MELKPLQQNFVNNLLKGMDQKNAYIKAGYKARGNSAESKASRLVRNGKVKAVYNKLQARAEKKNVGGRPPMFKSPKEMQAKIDQYFDSCWITDKDGFRIQTRPYTMSGLAIAIGTNRQTILNYSKKEGFFDTIKRARAICENYTEEQLFGKGQVAGVIFNLKNNYGWKDKIEKAITGKDGGAVKVELTPALDELITEVAGGWPVENKL